MINNFNERIDKLNALIYSNFSGDRFWDVYILVKFNRVGTGKPRKEYKKISSNVSGNPVDIKKEYYNKYKNETYLDEGHSLVKGGVLGGLAGGLLLPAAGAPIGAAVGAGIQAHRNKNGKSIDKVREFKIKKSHIIVVPAGSPVPDSKVN